VVQREDRRGKREEEEDLRREEIRGILRKVKDGKALGWMEYRLRSMEERG